MTTPQKPFASSLFPAPSRMAGKVCGLAEVLQHIECDHAGPRWELVLFREPTEPITPQRPHGDEYDRIPTCFRHGAKRQADINEPPEERG